MALWVYNEGWGAGNIQYLQVRYFRTPWATLFRYITMFFRIYNNALQLGLLFLQNGFVLGFRTRGGFSKLVLGLENSGYDLRGVWEDVKDVKGWICRHVRQKSSTGVDGGPSQRSSVSCHQTFLPVWALSFLISFTPIKLNKVCSTSMIQFIILVVICALYNLIFMHYL